MRKLRMKPRRKRPRKMRRVYGEAAQNRKAGVPQKA